VLELPVVVVVVILVPAFAERTDGLIRLHFRTRKS